jgi:alpha-1,3-rhamnosyl/mannosyltransferase
MASGTPVLGSNFGAISETAGDAALLVDPNSIDAIAGGMETLFRRGANRQVLIQRGLTRASEFSWDAAYQKLAQVMKDVGNG